MGFALSLCQYVSRPRLGLGQAFRAVSGFGNTEPLSSYQKGKDVVMIKTRRYKVLVPG
jgi:hypothetical protein